MNTDAHRYDGNGTGALAVFVLLLAQRSACACAACFGQDSGPMAQGMNWGIFTLLGVIVSVLVSVALFFVFLARRSAAQTAPGLPGSGKGWSVPASGTAISEPGKACGGIQGPAPSLSSGAWGRAHTGSTGEDAAVFEPGEPRPQTA